MIEPNNISSPIKIFDQNWQIFSKGELASEPNGAQIFQLIDIPNLEVTSIIVRLPSFPLLSLYKKKDIYFLSVCEDTQIQIFLIY